MIINFVGNFARGYVGEVADETHLADEIQNLGHTVRRIPRDEWREHVKQGLDYVNVPKDLKADANIICKWHHFYDGSFAEKLREKSGAPVFYWVWDYMSDQYNHQFPDWHIKMAQASDMYLGNDVRLGKLYEAAGVPPQKLYYFPFDASDKDFDRINNPGLPYADKKYDVVFFGSWMEKGDRLEWLTEINKHCDLVIFAFNHEKWIEAGFHAEPAVYGQDFAQKVAESRIILGFNVNDHCWGFWSNRTGKTLTTGGFLLQRYVPGMELFLRDGAEYFSSADEAVKKIGYYLENIAEREAIAERGYQIGRDRFTSVARVKELMIFIDRFKNGAFLR